MSASVKSEGVKEWAGLWLRVDQIGQPKSLSFDNLKDRTIKGTTDRKNYEIVLDVPVNSSLIAYGVLLAGTGQIWFDNFKFEIVNKSVPVTGSLNESSPELEIEPNNLNFEN